MIKKVITILFFIIFPAVVLLVFASQTSLIPSIKLFVVMSGSMEPKIPVGSIFIAGQQDGYTTGDVIAFNRDNEVITHRIVRKEIENNVFSFLTKGDANNTTDGKNIVQTDIIGKELLVIPYIGRVIVFTKTLPGFLLLIVLPCVIFILLELLNVKKELEKEIEKKILQRMQQAV